MLVGAAATDFTPVPGLILQGHLSKNPSTAVLYPLEARALFLTSNNVTLCIITLDIIGVELATTKRIRTAIKSQTGIPEENILIMASHTHCAPAMLKNLAMTPDATWLASVEQAAVDCAIQASKKAQPVTMGLGCSSAHFNVNRRPLPGKTDFSVNWGGVVDHRVRVLRIDDATGKPLAALFTYSCHPTTKPGSEGLISSDYPGVARALIERELGCHALFLPGCFGNIRPQINGVFTPATKEQLVAVGAELAAAVNLAARRAVTSQHDNIWIKQSELRLNFDAPKSTDDLNKMIADTSTLGAAVRSNWAQRTLDKIRTATIPQSLSSIMNAACIGPLALVTIPGEPVQEIGYRLERRLARTADFEDLWPLGYTNDQIGYLVTERYKEEGGYEPNAYTFYDRPAPYQNEEQVIVDTAAGMFT